MIKWVCIFAIMLSTQPNTSLNRSDLRKNVTMNDQGGTRLAVVMKQSIRSCNFCTVFDFQNASR